MKWLVGWILLAVLIAFYAAKLRRNMIGWFIVSMLLSPLFAGVLLLITGHNPSPDAPQNLQTQFTYGLIKLIKSPYFWLLLISVLTGFYLAGQTGGALPP